MLWNQVGAAADGLGGGGNIDRAGRPHSGDRSSGARPPECPAATALSGAVAVRQCQVTTTSRHLTTPGILPPVPDEEAVEILEFHIEEYKSLRAMRVPWSAQTVLYGQNGVGETNLLEVDASLVGMPRCRTRKAERRDRSFPEVPAAELGPVPRRVTEAAPDDRHAADLGLGDVLVEPVDAASYPLHGLMSRAALAAALRVHDRGLQRSHGFAQVLAAVAEHRRRGAALATSSRSVRTKHAVGHGVGVEDVDGASWRREELALSILPRVSPEQHSERGRHAHHVLVPLAEGLRDPRPNLLPATPQSHGRLVVAHLHGHDENPERERALGRCVVVSNVRELAGSEAVRLH